MKATLTYAAAFVNRNGNPTVSCHIDVADTTAVVYMSLNGGAKAITFETLHLLGLTAGDFGKTVALPCEVEAEHDPIAGTTSYRFLGRAQHDGSLLAGF